MYLFAHISPQTNYGLDFMLKITDFCVLIKLTQISTLTHILLKILAQQVPAKFMMPVTISLFTMFHLKSLSLCYNPQMKCRHRDKNVNMQYNYLLHVNIQYNYWTEQCAFWTFKNSVLTGWNEIAHYSEFISRKTVKHGGTASVRQSPVVHGEVAQTIDRLWESCVIQKCLYPGYSFINSVQE